MLKSKTSTKDYLVNILEENHLCARYQRTRRNINK